MSNTTSNETPEDNWPQTFISLKQVQFRWLLSGSVLFFLSMQGQIVVRSFLVWDLTQSKMALAAVNLGAAIPMLICSIIGGAMADRMERRKLIFLAQSLMLITEVAVLILVLLDMLKFEHLLISSIVIGTSLPFIMPARQAITYNVVGREYLANAMALSASFINLTRVIGPVIFGFIAAAYGATGSYSASVCLILIAILTLLFVDPSPPPDVDPNKSIFDDAIQGLSYVASHRQILICVIFGLLPMVFVQPLQSLLVVFADEVWQVGESGLGYLLAASGLGGVLGALLIAKRGDNPNRIRLMVFSTFAVSFFLVLFSQMAYFYLALAFLVLVNVFTQAAMVLNNTAIQLMVDDAVRGRISSVMMMSFGLSPLGVLPLAYFATLFGAPMAMSGAAAILILLTILFYYASPTLRTMDKAVQGINTAKSTG